MWVLWLLLLFQITSSGNSESSVFMIRNYSFEDGPVGCCQTPPEWVNCGAMEETPPDIHCNQCKNAFGVQMKAPHGKQFLALVVRSNGTKECLQQELSRPLLPDSIYRLQLFLGRSAVFNSMDRNTNEAASYASLADLKIYGMTESGFVKELSVIRPFTGADWTEYSVLIKPEKEIDVLIFEAGYLGRQDTEVYNGHILLDYIRLELVSG
ncbi:MAG: hypothetical protein KDC34_15945 [Saprospiraceae bacterium]|nr:hypothetical protein [Saprospiraceae bacterium]